jgi:hypothetical protein
VLSLGQRFVRGRKESMMRGRPSGALLLAALTVICLSGSAWAQQTGGVVITSAPQGAIVELVGEHVFRGVTPWRLDRGLSGAYEVFAYKDGYEKWEGYALLSTTRRDSVFIRLTRKAPLNAGIRSGIVPGWGQFYTGQKVKGTLFFLAEAAALGVVLYADGKRTDAQNDYNEAWRAYVAADDVDEIEAAFAEVGRRYDELYKWHDNRKRWSYVAAAVWLANVLDAALLFPSSGGAAYSELPAGESGFFASIEPDRATAGFAVRF